MNCVACGKQIDLVICGTCGKAALPPVRVQAVVRLSECDLEEARRFAMSTLQTEEERNGAAFMYGALLKKFVKSAPDAWACDCGTDNDWCDKVCVACGSDRPNNRISETGNHLDVP
jgi:hypothetical protein